MAVLIDILAAGAIDTDGSALASGTAYVYQIGTTQKATIYSDSDLTLPVSNPVTLDAAGRAEVYAATAVRLVLEDSDGNAVDDIAVVGSEATTTTTNTDIVASQLVPIGTIIPFYDFDGDLAFNTSYWAYCDGSTATVGGVSRTLPDLSARYLVGFGTEAGQDIDTATWDASAVGNASHQIDISHTHTVPAHGHRIPDATTGTNTGVVDLSVASAGAFGTYSFAAGSLGQYTEGYGANGGVNGSAEMTSGSAGSSTQSIQPRSIRVRFLMRRA